MTNLAVREAADQDLEEVRTIYSFYVLHGTSTFEEIPPSVGELHARRKAVADARLPFLVAALDGQIAGYAYATLYRPRPAYRHTVETSVYIADGRRGQGVGSALLSELIRRCETENFRQMVAVIGDSGNAASIALHRRFGFQQIGTLRSVGFKLGQWLDTVLMQRALGTGDRTLPG
jgi:L-amino acid N-acyltransferase YncA